MTASSRFPRIIVLLALLFVFCGPAYGRVFPTGQTINRPLSPDSNVVASDSGSPDKVVLVSFMYVNAMTYWSATVSPTQTTATLGQDRGNGHVIFKQGLKVEYVPQGQHHMIIVTGTVIESGSTYNFVGYSLGTFPD